MSLFRNENPILGAAAKVRSNELGADVKIIPTEYVSTELVATSATTFFWVAPYPCQVTAVKEVHSTASSLVGASTVQPRKITADGIAPNAAAGASVKELTAAAIDLKASTNTVRSAALSATVTDVQLAKGDRLAYNVVGGAPTSLVGYLQIELKKI